MPKQQPSEIKGANEKGQSERDTAIAEGPGDSRYAEPRLSGQREEHGLWQPKTSKHIF